MKGRDGYTPLNVNTRQPGPSHMSDDNRYTSTPPPNGKIPYYQQGTNNHDIIETPISVNRPKFDFSG